MNDIADNLVRQAYDLARTRNIPIDDAVAIVRAELERVIKSLPPLTPSDRPDYHSHTTAEGTTTRTH